MMELAYICCPCKGHSNQYFSLEQAIHDNQRKAAQYCRYILDKYNFIPVCPTLFLPRVLNAEDSDEERKAQDICLDLVCRCDYVFVFGDLLTEGMRADISTLLYVPKFISQAEVDRHFAKEDASCGTT